MLLCCILYIALCASFIYQFYNVALNNILIIHVGTTGLSIIICSMWYFIVKKMVMLKVISLVLLFMIRTRFPGDKSITYILRSRYGSTLVKEVRKFEKIDYKLRKCMLDVVFLERCLENKIIPKSLNFRGSNLHLKTSRAYDSYQLKLLREEISVKKSKAKIFEKDFIVLKES